jgi:hypothetical protein
LQRQEFGSITQRLAAKLRQLPAKVFAFFFRDRLASLGLLYLFAEFQILPAKSTHCLVDRVECAFDVAYMAAHIVNSKTMSQVNRMANTMQQISIAMFSVRSLIPFKNLSSVFMMFPMGGKETSCYTDCAARAIDFFGVARAVR